jgi:hypothetical protein
MSAKGAAMPIRFIILLLFTASFPALAAEVETVPLYRFGSPRLNWIFTTSPTLPAELSDGPWERQAIVGHVPKPSALTRPVWSLVKGDDELGARYAYTSDPTESPAGWHRDPTPAFHVAKDNLPGSVPLYRLYAPLRRSGHRAVTGTDTHYYTADRAKRDEAVAAGWVDQGILGYVWREPQRERRIKIRDQGETLIVPTITIVGVDSDPKPGQPERTRYTLEVMNLSAFPAKWFVAGKGMWEGNECGASRMRAFIYVKRGETVTKAGCEELPKHNSLQTVSFTQPKRLSDNDTIILNVDDQLTGLSYRSYPYAAGWYGIQELLAGVGCKTLLGMSGSFVCTEKAGYTACEKFRTSGKPVKCRLAGKK